MHSLLTLPRLNSTSGVWALRVITFMLLGPAMDASAARDLPLAALGTRHHCPKVTMKVLTETQLETLNGQKPATPPPAGNNDKIAFWTFAWEQFLHLNLTAKAGARGVPAPGTTLSDLKGQRVWETWMTSDQIFLPDAKEPVSWSRAVPVRDLKPLTQHGKMHDHLRRGSEIDEAVGGKLLDRNCNFARFEVAINEPMYNQIRSKRWYNALTQLAEKHVEFPVGSVELKAAWKILELNKEDLRVLDPALKGHDKNCRPSKKFDDPSRYLTAKARVYDHYDLRTGKGVPPNGVEVTVGLVGMHLVTRDKSRPQRIWATFEQVDNVKIHKEYAGVVYKGQALTPSFFTPGLPNTGNNRHNLRIHYQTDPQNPVPVQVTRAIPLGVVNGKQSGLPAMNNQVRAWLCEKFPDAPWQYYQLIGVQWPKNPNLAKPNGTGRDGDPTPVVLGNSVIETFNQKRSSCLGCHSFARPVNKYLLSDFSWIMGHANFPSIVTPKAPSAEQLYAFVTQFVPYQPNPTTNTPPMGPNYKTWGSYPNSKWNTYSGFMEGENPHGNWTRIYLNDTARVFADRWANKPLREGDPGPEFPEGSIVLKENHKTWAADELIELTVMLKREGGYNPEGGNWYWLKVSPSGVVDRAGKVDGCISCHKPSPAGDFMLTWNYGREPWIHNYPAQSSNPRTKKPQR